LYQYQLIFSDICELDTTVRDGKGAGSIVQALDLNLIIYKHFWSVMCLLFRDAL